MEFVQRGYKAKTIKAVIRKKLDAWINSIEDETVQDLVSRGTIVTGGCIASMLLGEPVNDFDVYLKDHATAVAVAKYYVSKFHPKNRHGIAVAIGVRTEDNQVKIIIKSAGIASEKGTVRPYEYFESSEEGAAGRYVEDIILGSGEAEEKKEEIEQSLRDNPPEGLPAYRPVFMSTNAITLSDKLQIVLRFFGEPDEIHQNYDFIHCTNYYKSWDHELCLRPAALESLLSRELRYAGSKFPICSIIRVRKFIRRGWTINAGQILKMCMQISKLDLSDPDVLQDQLTGVDVAYFAELIGKLRDKDPEKINSAYLIEIIDRLF